MITRSTRSTAPLPSTSPASAKVEKALGIENLYESKNGQLVNHLMQALRAHALFKKDVEYVVKDGEVLIVDEFTGRIMEGRRYSEGLHQAIEAKEKVRIREENQTLATITLQNYFRMYDKLAGMTGTAATEADEFMHIYKLEVVSIPTNQPMVRDDRNDFIFKTKKAKFRAAADDIVECHKKGQPVLVGTVSIETSEYLSDMLTRRGVPHQVLNAKHHEKEAEIIQHAGEAGQVTIATNMAGRGVDIKLDESVRDLGGLYVLGTERHESRRIDNQLRGRSGRQGDPGASRFYLSAEDDVIRLFAGDRIYNILDKLSPDEDMPIQHKMLSKTVENAQRKVEQQNFQTRKRVLEYDDVMNKQREVIYEQRRKILEGGDISEDCSGDHRRGADRHGRDLLRERRLSRRLGLGQPLRLTQGVYTTSPSARTTSTSRISTQEELIEKVLEDAHAIYERKEQDFSSEHMRQLERLVMMGVIDNRWREHLYDMDYLREGIHWRSLSQKDPLVEYKSEGFTHVPGTAGFHQGRFRAHHLPHEPRAPGRAGRAPRARPASTPMTTALLRDCRRLPSRLPPVRAPPGGGSWRSGSRSCRRRRRRSTGRGRHAGMPTRSDATTPVPAARARSTRSAAGSKRSDIVSQVQAASHSEA